MINAMVCGLSLNISLSKANAFGLIFGPARLIPIIINIVKKNDKPMQFRNGGMEFQTHPYRLDKQSTGMFHCQTMSVHSC
jgi:hypothetical protein